jgi:23S rRNA pseudouridine2605 synthase
MQAGEGRERPQAQRPGRPPRAAGADDVPHAKRQRPERKPGSTRIRADGTAAAAPRARREPSTQTPERQQPERQRPERKSGSTRVRSDGTAAAAPREAHKAGAPQRIAKLLARAGIASRREIERMIAERRIAIDGAPVETPATILTSLKGVSVDGKPVSAAAETRLFLFHKPTGLITAERDPAGRPTIYDRIPKDLPRLMPVGRLDLNTEGLLLLTNDGEFKRQLELPRTGIERVYRARVFGEISQEQLETLIEGIEIEGIRYGSIDANLERRTGRNSWVEMRLTEGKNREVRRVLEYLGLQVSRLIRLAYGPFVLRDLPVGAIGEIKQHDLIEFRKGLK